MGTFRLIFVTEEDSVDERQWETSGVLHLLFFWLGVKGISLVLASKGWRDLKVPCWMIPRPQSWVLWSLSPGAGHGRAVRVGRSMGAGVPPRATPTQAADLFPGRSASSWRTWEP